jgi:hypothetical protein
MTVSALTSAQTTTQARSDLIDEPATTPLAGPFQEHAPAAPSAPEPSRRQPAVPVVRFTRPSAITPPPGPAGAPDTLETVPRLRQRTSQIEIGAALVERHRSGRGWLVAVGVAALVLLGVGIVVIVALRRDPEVSKPAPPAVQPAPTTGLLTFQVQPTDAEIRLEGKEPHVGSPWSIELAGGVHAVEIRRSGYKAWLSSVELAANENQRLRVELLPIGSNAASAEGTLSLTSTPPGLETFLDGLPLAQRTPFKIQVKAGPHTIVVKQGGVEIWRHSIKAEANSEYELHAHADAAPAAHPGPEPGPDSVGSGISTTPDGSAAVPAPVPAPAPSPTPLTPPTPAPHPAPVPVSGPLFVAPKAVTRLSGATPSFRAKPGELPPVIVAKLCIDTGGTVISTEVVTKIGHDVALPLAATLRTWRYAPYRLPTGLAAPVCFTVSFKIDSGQSSP